MAVMYNIYIFYIFLMLYNTTIRILTTITVAYNLFPFVWGDKAITSLLSDYLLKINK